MLIPKLFIAKWRHVSIAFSIQFWFHTILINVNVVSCIIGMTLMNIRYELKYLTINMENPREGNAPIFKHSIFRITPPERKWQLQLATEKVPVYIGLQLISSIKVGRRRFMYTQFSYHNISRVLLQVYKWTGQ